MTLKVQCGACRDGIYWRSVMNGRRVLSAWAGRRSQWRWYTL